jgi:FtsH-binding integral membrane protein
MDAAHIHLLLNHVPILGTILATFLFAYAFFRNSDELKRLSMFLLVLAAVVAVPVFLTGEPSEEIVERLTGVDDRLIEEHESAATFALIFVIAAGLFSLFAMLLMRGRKEIAKWLVLGALVCGGVSAAAMARAGNLGGMIRHAEIRGTDAVTTTPADPRQNKKDDDDH